jgi:hypothetical protein
VGKLTLGWESVTGSHLRFAYERAEPLAHVFVETATLERTERGDPDGLSLSPRPRHVPPPCGIRNHQSWWAMPAKAAVGSITERPEAAALILEQV